LNEQTAAYSEAVDYACKVLGNDAPKYFFRLHQLSQHNSKEELESIIDSWYHATLPKPPRQVAPGLWTPGSQWGTAGAVRVEHITGIMWKIRCACGVIFECSTNDTIPEYQRACPKCRLIDEMSRTRKKINAILDENAQTVLEWYESHDNVVWKRVHRACLTRSIDDYRFKQELHALVWLHISENAGKYRDKGVKASAWIGRVASNIVADYFKTQYNRQELVPLPQPQDPKRSCPRRLSGPRVQIHVTVR
jgi:hypothetical protein